MATKVFCDRCGDESGEGWARGVRKANLTREVGSQPTTTVDLCGACYDVVKRTMTEVLPQASEPRA